MVICRDGVNQSSDFKLTLRNALNGYLCCILLPCSLFTMCKLAHILEYWILNYRIGNLMP